jgi:hypothetical protein
MELVLNERFVEYYDQSYKLNNFTSSVQFPIAHGLGMSLTCMSYVKHDCKW